MFPSSRIIMWEWTELNVSLFKNNEWSDWSAYKLLVNLKSNNQFDYSVYHNKHAPPPGTPLGYFVRFLETVVCNYIISHGCSRLQAQDTKYSVLFIIFATDRYHHKDEML